MLKHLLFLPLFISVLPTHAQWTVAHNDPNKVFDQVVFPDDLHGYAMGHYVSGGSFILRTSDGGLDWDTINLPFSYLSRIYMTGPLKGYAYKSGSPNSIIHTNNGFTNFSGPAGMMDSCFSYLGVGAINDSTNFQLLNEGRLHKTYHYGTYFTSVWDSLTNFNILNFPSSTVGYIIGGQKVMKTTNAGATWNFITTSLPFYAMQASFTSVNTAYLVAEDGLYERSLRKTTDGCVSFTTVSSFKMRNLAARSNYCLLVDSAGNVSYTSNGGLSWTNEATGILSSGSEDFVLDVTPAGHAWLASSYGQLMTRSGTLSMEEITSENNVLNVYPNPAGEMVNVVMKDPTASYTCKVYNNIGECLQTVRFQGDRYTLSLAAIPAGIYYLQVSNEQNTTTTKLIKH